MLACKDATGTADRPFPAPATKRNIMMMGLNGLSVDVEFGILKYLLSAGETRIATPGTTFRTTLPSHLMFLIMKRAFFRKGQHWPISSFPDTSQTAWLFIRSNNL